MPQAVARRQFTRECMLRVSSGHKVLGMKATVGNESRRWPRVKISLTTGFEWGIAGAKGQLLAAGRGTIAGSGTAASLAVERLTYHALLAGLQAFLAEDYAGALTIAAAPAFIALLRPGEQAEDAGLQRLRRQAIQLLNQVRGELTLHEQVVVPPLFVEAAELARRAAKPLPPRVIAFVTQLNANPSAVTDEDLIDFRFAAPIATRASACLSSCRSLSRRSSRRLRPRFLTRLHHRPWFCAGIYAA
jgi:hypothetical protein